MGAAVVGLDGVRAVGKGGVELAEPGGRGGRAGSRGVIINGRGEIVEDVASIRAPQEGRDLALSIDSRLQYLAFRELKAAVEANKAKAGALVMLDARTGEILAMANWPAFNPNNRQRAARDHMRNRALHAEVGRWPSFAVGAVWGAMLFLIAITQGNSNAFIYFQF